MQTDDSNVFTRDDTFFGVCQAIGDDLGFNPNWLRAVFGVMLIYSPVASIGTYLALGIVIAAIRWIVPDPRVAKAVAAEPAAADAAVESDNDEAPLAAAA
jgi:hypothetical protein